MNLKTVTNKRGSYILEASIVLPIFLVAVIVMCSIILTYHTIENANFILGTELRRAAAEAIYANTSILIPRRIESRIQESSSRVSKLTIADYSYRANKFEQDELIAIKYKMQTKTDNPLDLATETKYDLSLVTRAYVGKEREINSMSIEDMLADGSAVYIFPKRGEKYHSQGCSFLTAASVSSPLTKSIKDKYDSCPVCHSRKAALGTLIYYFPQDGESYHLTGCPTLERNYIELEKRVAVKRGYTACSKCGG